TSGPSDYVACVRYQNLPRLRAGCTSYTRPAPGSRRCRFVIGLLNKIFCYVRCTPCKEAFQELCKQSSDIRSESDFEEQPPQTSVNTATLDSIHSNPHYPICKDITQYQILLQHYIILMQTLQSHFSSIANSIPHK
ncbi:unnamed protein product, partial [Meganyctiphanes norvegica]